MYIRNLYIIGLLLTSLSFFILACSDEENGQNNEQTGGDTDNEYINNLPEYSTPDRSRIASFPGAEGAGKYTTGGAGGTVYTVTSLADDGSEGTLRWAVEQPGKRTIVFAVGGVISLTKKLQIKNGDITIAGQTAPQPGICLKGNTLNISADNVIIRFIRSRMGDETQTEDDAMNGYQKEYPGKKNIIIDHCSMSWSTDECASFYGNSNFTMQWCIISESLTNSIHGKGKHGYGGLWGGTPATFHHNLIAHHSNRTPRLCGSRYSNKKEMENVDIINNVIYNWTGEGAYGAQGGYYNLMNNYYKPGPASVSAEIHCRLFTAYINNEVDANEENQAAGIYGKFYVNGNYMDNTVTGLTTKQQEEIAAANADNTSESAFKMKVVNAKGNEVKEGIVISVPSREQYLSSSQFVLWQDYRFMQEAQTAYQSVLAYAGASNIPDKIDTRIIKETREGTVTYSGSIGGLSGLIDTQTDVEGWDEYIESRSTLTDTDGDGIPDNWETENGLNPNDKNDGSKYNLSKEYTNLEVYLNSLVNSLYPITNN